MQSWLETKLESDISKWALEELGVASIHLNLRGNSGWPDRIFLMPLRPAWLEFKREKEKPRRLQEYRMKALRKLGYDVTWSNDEDECKQWLKKIYAARLSEASNQVDDRAGGGGPVPRPGPR